MTCFLTLPLGVIDIAFLDIAIGTMTGVDLARCIKTAYPGCDIVFTTGYSEYAHKAFELGASDYLMKPVTVEKIEHALSQLRHNALKGNIGNGLFIQCFGDFEVFYNREPVVSFTKRSRMSIEEMILGYTINGAKQLGIEDKKGSIEVGKDADYLVFDNDLLTAELKAQMEHYHKNHAPKVINKNMALDYTV